MIFENIVALLCLFVRASSVFSDSYIDAQFYISSSETPCLFFKIKDQADIIVLTEDQEHLANVHFYSPIDNQLIYSSIRLHYHKFSYTNGSQIPQEAGEYQICIDSSEYSTSKASLVVTFKENGVPLATNNLQNLPKDIEERVRENDFRFASFDNITRRIDSKLSVMSAEQRKISAIERVDRRHIEEAFESVNKYGLLHTFVMVSTALIQVYFIRSLLSQDSKVGGFLRKERYSHSY